MTAGNAIGIFLVTSVIAIGSVAAQEITPTPGTYELLEGKSMQFDARQKDAKVTADRFEWQIVAGEGARLLNANSARVTFVAPSKLEEESRNFTLQLTTHYPKGNKSSEARINIRVHKKTKKIANLAKAGKQASLTPGTFTVSNMGMMNVDNFIAIINPPETAILAVASTRKKLVVSEDNTMQIRDMMNMTLSADHRAVDGALASQFINQIKYCLENPQTLLG